MSADPHPAPRATLAGIRRVYTGWSSVSVVTLSHPDGRSSERHVEDHGPTAAVLPYDELRRCALVITLPRGPQLLAGCGEALLECPAGLIGPGETPAQAVRREALEEAGLRLGSLDLVVEAWTMPGVSTERTHLFLAPYEPRDRVAAGGGAPGEDEDVEVFEVPLAELWRAARSGELRELKLLVLVFALQSRRPDLFQDPDQATGLRS